MGVPHATIFIEKTLMEYDVNGNRKPYGKSRYFPENKCKFAKVTADDTIMMIKT